MKKKQANIKTSKKLFFTHWLNFTKPFHKLTSKEIEVVSLLLYYYTLYSKDTNNKTILNKMVFDYDTKMLIKKELNNMKDQILQNVLSGLRRKKVIVKNQLNPVYIPDFDLETNNFKLIFNFIINAEKDNKKN